MKILKIILLFTVINYCIFKNVVNGLEYIQAMYDNKDCKNTPISIQSSSQCAKGIYVVPQSSKRVTISYGIKSPSDCSSKTPSAYDQDVNYCLTGSLAQMFLNENANVSGINGYCSELVQFADDDCENILLNSYLNGACVGPQSNGYFNRYLCNGNVVKRYNCPSDCRKASGVSGCVFDKELKSISSCPNIKSKNIQDLIKIDGKVDTSSTSSSSGATGGGGTGNNGTSATGGSGATGAASGNGGATSNAGNSGGASTTGKSNAQKIYVSFFLLISLSLLILILF
ncbi:hypothetical protein DDB_G0272586 [Dictyostelium discoideum AX4]|uniref:Uncharacterized protein n=1 Tax=Dictyostelium discoideum TaxID=44689 RepID=Q556K5_DICDI|nr:hypothetical protein DDB_G0273989 [Dictyostelium discoideum AX4]XP_645061.1 hypothetical protein DDB_G0272586 [Dictyostelium discoideum AX4]EAL70428.1 hypothetical protein DDB_G0273989 [Dictyostelium discoideum AX4]EAL70930.1 hypothetical protein DDB_G0272586 [Dictyostelium discoideum AX4]|eukprot:XP_644353.1 hypothetical protein DDB_G0273989 [Dictyostelium discoideum AX4]